MGPRENADVSPLKKASKSRSQRQVRVRNCYRHDNMGEVLERAPEMDTEYTENTTARQTVKCASDLPMRSENYSGLSPPFCD